MFKKLLYPDCNDIVHEAIDKVVHKKLVSLIYYYVVNHGDMALIEMTAKIVERQGVVSCLVYPSDEEKELMNKLEELIREIVEMRVELERRRSLSKVAEESKDETKDPLDPNGTLFHLRVSSLELSTRSCVALGSAGISRIYQLVPLSPKELLEIKNLGRKSLNEIKEALSSAGLSLEMKLRVEESENRNLSITVIKEEEGERCLNG